MTRAATRAALVCLIALCLGAPVAWAHKVILAVYPAGDAIEGEVGFSNGDMAANQTIVIADAEGQPLAELTTDHEGYFRFVPTAHITHVFRADLGAGHVAQATVTVEDLPATLADTTSMVTLTAPRVAPAEAGVASARHNAAPDAQPRIDQAALAAMIRDELRPLRRELTSYKEKNDLQNVLGGIGYIFGLFGLAMYLAARRKLEAQST